MKFAAANAVAQAARRPLPQLDDALGLRVAHRFEEDAVHQAEDGGVRAQPEGDGQRREERESRAALHNPPGIADVLPQGFDGGSHGSLLWLVGDRGRRPAQLAQ
jgi:hypothetical protein